MCQVCRKTKINDEYQDQAGSFKDDVQGLKDIIDSSDLFPSALLDEMMENYFNDPASTDTWLTATYESTPIVVAYYAPEKLTEGTFNLYLIAVHKKTSKVGEQGRR